MSTPKKKYYISEIFKFTRENFAGIHAAQERFGLSSMDESINFIIERFIKAYKVEIDKRYRPFPEQYWKMLIEQVDEEYETLMEWEKNKNA